MAAEDHTPRRRRRQNPKLAADGSTSDEEPSTEQTGVEAIQAACPRIPFCVLFAWGPIFLVIVPLCALAGYLRNSYALPCPKYMHGRDEHSTHLRSLLLKRESAALSLLPWP